MKNSHQSGKFRKLLSEKGDLFILILCAAAVCVSGYIFVSAAVRRNAPLPEESLSVPLTPTVPDEPRERPSQATAVVEPESVPTILPDDGETARLAARSVIVLPVRGETIRDFSTQALSYNETTQDWRLHSAVDIAAEGQKVVACMAGTVENVFEDDYLGTTVILSHDDGIETVYANLAAVPTVNVGQEVEAGEVIGAVGTSAILESASAPHLHFQVFRNGEAIDPIEFLS